MSEEYLSTSMEHKLELNQSKENISNGITLKRRATDDILSINRQPTLDRKSLLRKDSDQKYVKIEESGLPTISIILKQGDVLISKITTNISESETMDTRDGFMDSQRKIFITSNVGSTGLNLPQEDVTIFSTSHWQ